MFRWADHRNPERRRLREVSLGRAPGTPAGGGGPGNQAGGQRAAGRTGRRNTGRSAGRRTGGDRDRGTGQGPAGTGQTQTGAEAPGTKPGTKPPTGPGPGPHGPGTKPGTKPPTARDRDHQAGPGRGAGPARPTIPTRMSGPSQSPACLSLDRAKVLPASGRRGATLTPSTRAEPPLLLVLEVALAGDHAVERLGG